MKKSTNAFLLGLVVVAGAGCSSLGSEIHQRTEAKQAEIRAMQEKAEKPQPVVTFNSGAWIAGGSIKVAEPVLPILNIDVGYHPTKPVSLTDIAAWIMQTTNLAVDVSEIFSTQTIGQPVQSPLGTVGAPVNPSYPVVPSITGALPGQVTPQIRESMYSMYVNYDGKLSGLLDVVANKSSSWWRVVDGRVIFYKALTKTFYLPTINRKFIATDVITAGGTGNTTSGSGGLSSNTNSSSVYAVDLWTDIEKTAKTVAGGGQVSVNPSGASVTVTGTPQQVRQVEDWAKTYAEQLSEQVSINVRIYAVRIKREDSFSWSPVVIFKPDFGVVSAAINGIKGPSPASTVTPLGVTTSIASTASNTTQFSGTQLAFNALSVLGEVSETTNQTVVTMNGQPVPMQVATNKGFIQSSSTTQTVNVGSTTSMAQGTQTTGLSAMFLPRVSNGRVVLAITLSNSVDNGFEKVEANGSVLYLPNIDSSNFQQSVTLVPGEALMLTNLSKGSDSGTKNGVVSPGNMALGGGYDYATDRRMIAIVITASIL